MDSGRIFFDRSSCGHGNMMFLGNGDSLFRGARSMMNMEETSKKRPFFTSPEELFDEEYYDEQSPEKKRRLTPQQGLAESVMVGLKVHMLEESFEAENKLEPDRKTQLANKLGLHPRQVAVWFQNRRARWKTKQLERDYDLLKSSFDKLQSDYSSILKHNENLKSEVVSLTEKLQEKVVEAAISVRHRVDRLSSGTGESVVVDEDGPQLGDSRNSYFTRNDFGAPCMEPLERIRSKEDEGQSCFINVFTATDRHNQEEPPLGWLVWS